MTYQLKLRTACYGRNGYFLDKQPLTTAKKKCVAYTYYKISARTYIHKTYQGCHPIPIHKLTMSISNANSYYKNSFEFFGKIIKIFRISSS